MPTMTIRGLDDMTLKALKERAKQEGSSVNATLVNLLKEEFGMKKKKRALVYDDLNHLAGTWTEKDFKEFNKRIKDFEKVDEKMWK